MRLGLKELNVLIRSSDGLRSLRGSFFNQTTLPREVTLAVPQRTSSRLGGNSKQVQRNRLSPTLVLRIDSLLAKNEPVVELNVISDLFIRLQVAANTPSSFTISSLNRVDWVQVWV